MWKYQLQVMTQGNQWQSIRSFPTEAERTKFLKSGAFKHTNYRTIESERHLAG